MGPLVSVLFITYNEESYVREALDSILEQQTNFDFEILCHDDASSDNTPEIIKEYKNKYPNIIVPILQTENQMKKGINIVIENMYPKAQGKYIAYCDGDDYWTDKRKLQKQVDFLENHQDYVMCLHQFDFLYEKSGKKVRASCGKIEKDFVTEDFINWDTKLVPQIGTALFIKELACNRPELFQKIGGGKNSLRPISDMPLYIFLSLSGNVKYIPESMSVWRRRVSGTWGNEASLDINKKYNFYKQHIYFLKGLNEYTNWKFGDIIERKINAIRTYIAYESFDFKSCRKVIWKSSRSFRGKLFMSFACFFPDIAKMIIRKRKALTK